MSRAPYWLRKARREQDARHADPGTLPISGAKDLCVCGHTREDHMPWGCEPMAKHEDGKFIPATTCTCTEFVKKEETTSK